MMTISLELPPGVAAPTIRGKLTGPPDDLRIEIRLADFIEAIKLAQAAGFAPGRGRPQKSAPPTSAPLPAPGESVSAGTRPSPTQDAMIAHLRGGDCTRTELLKAAAEKLGTTTMATAVAFEKLKGKGLIEKYEDANNGGLPKWRLVNK